MEMGLVVCGASGLKAPAPRGCGARRVRAGLRPSSSGRLGAACPLPATDGWRSAPKMTDNGSDRVRNTYVSAEIRQNRFRLEAKRVGQQAAGAESPQSSPATAVLQPPRSAMRGGGAFSLPQSQVFAPPTATGRTAAPRNARQLDRQGATVVLNAPFGDRRSIPGL